MSSQRPRRLADLLLPAAALVALLPCGLLVAQDGQDQEAAPPLPADNLPAVLARSIPAGLPDDLDQHWQAAEATVQLGRRLFFDPVLSIDHTVACASCHQPDHGFADPTALSLGVHGRRTLRNAPSLVNRALGKAFMWDGRLPTLESQVLQPILNEREMGLPLDAAIKRLQGDASYVQAFESTFKRVPDIEALSDALSAFVRRIVAGDSPVDRFHAGDFGALGKAARGGMWIFESRGQCWRCHSGPNFSDESFHNTGVGAQGQMPEPGRFDFTGDEQDHGRFKTPTLRELTHTAPYMHNGSLATLEEVVEFYRKGGHGNSHLDERMAPVEMSDKDAANLVAFLRALSSTK